MTGAAKRTAKWERRTKRDMANHDWILGTRGLPITLMGNRQRIPIVGHLEK